ncbi:ATP/GTP-binding protein [Kocuria sabuli]|uniref:ATP/GTP-binding protein n=1 Tax=Kocuria sabuli TaxID=3071448 RepID=UPI0034D603C2
MRRSRALEQHIAVFGESGSGKTVMLSSFYGAAQEPDYLRENLFHVVADNFGQGNRLHRNYLGMKNAVQLPNQNRFSATSYSFSVKLKDGADAEAMKSRPFDALRLVWHDYPGEWFEEGVSGPEEAQRRISAFRDLLSSDIALLLVDGQRLLDHSGEEERYLKSLFTNFRNGLLSLKDDLLEDGKPLSEFPRIWIMALSKSDLLPDMDVFAFRDLLVEKASDDVDELRRVIAGLVESNDALSVGEDFMLISSAKFEPGRIEVTKRIGLELILPLAALLPFERHVRWAQLKLLPGRVGEKLVTKGAVPLMVAALLGTKSKRAGKIGLVLSLLNPDVVNNAANVAGDKLRALNADALARRDYLKATLTQFKIDLENAEDQKIFLRSP